MNAISRRETIVDMLVKDKKPIKGIVLAETFNVTRQIIVKDIAILRAKGNNIIATPDGYMINIEANDKLRRIIAVNHDNKHISDELEIVIKYGGIVEDVIVEHPLYGEIRANLMIKNMNDLNNFTESFLNNKAKPLSELTNGIHLHTILVDSQKEFDLINKELKANGFIL